MHLGLLLCALVVVGSRAPASAQAANQKNAPQNCPYCEGDPQLMKAAGLVSHGGFRFGMTDTAGVDALLATSDIRWIETPHFEVGIALAGYRPSQDERKKVEAELQELNAVLPKVSPKTKLIDPWLRTHIYALRVEKIWRRFLEVMQVEESDFPSADHPWIIGTPYMGEGPYVGQRGKYELLIVPTIAVHVSFLREQFGLQIKKTQRWNIVDHDTMIAVMHVEDGDLRDDSALHGHVAFNLTVNMLDGYKHYSYETPYWLREGLAHFVERELNPEFNTFDSSEGGIADMTNKSDWVPAVRKMIQSNDAPRLAELIDLKSFAELTLEHHFATWSMTVFLIQQHPKGYACLNDRLHGRKTADGYADGSNLNDVHRDAIKECLGWSYTEFDQAWREWALIQ